MSTDETVHETAPPRKNPGIWRVVAGVLLLLPAVWFWFTDLLLPTIYTIWKNLFWIGVRTNFPADPTIKFRFFGLSFYAVLFESDNFISALGFTLLMAGVRVLVVSLVPLLLAWAVSRFGRRLRIVLRVLLMLPVAFYVPVTMAAAWWLLLKSPASPIPSWSGMLYQSDVNFRPFVLTVDALYLFGLACGLGLVIFLPAWRRPAGVPQPAFKEMLRPILITWLIGVLATVIITLGEFAFVLILTGATRAQIGTLAFRPLWTNHWYNIPSASLASIFLPVVLLAGWAAGRWVLRSRLRLDLIDRSEEVSVEDRGTTRKPGRILPGIELGLLLLVIAGAGVFSLLPFGWLLPHYLDGDAVDRMLKMINPSADNTMIPVRFLNYTFIPPFITATVQVLVAYLAALEIGALQLLGKRSERLLLFFSPWLFATVILLSPGLMVGLSENIIARYISPILLSVPMLFILSLFFKGRVARQQLTPKPGEHEGVAAIFKRFVLPSLPLAGVLWLFRFFMGWQEYYWTKYSSWEVEIPAVSIWMERVRWPDEVWGTNVAPMIPLFVLPVCILIFIGFSLFQAFYLDRLMLFSSEQSGSSGQGGE